MNTVHIEMLYLQRRRDATLAMAAAAAGPCARTAHELLARLYEVKLEALAVEAASLVVESVLRFAVPGVCATPHMLRPVPRRARLTLKLAS